MINEMQQQLSTAAKDIRINLSNVLTEEGAKGLSQKQIDHIALSCAYATKNTMLIDTMRHEAARSLSEEEIASAHSAASIMAMNNVYYRFIHLVNKESYKRLPAQLRMTVLANPGIDKNDFELSCLAVSAINGCGMCMESHTAVLENNGVTPEAIQSAVRIASVINAVTVGLLKS